MPAGGKIGAGPAKAKSTTSATPPKGVAPKNGRSYKTVPGKRKANSGGDADTHATAKRATKGMKPGPGVHGTKAEPYLVKNSRGGSYKTVAPRDQRDSGMSVDEWCRGKRATPW